jgi:hypothetical protein
VSDSWTVVYVDLWSRMTSKQERSVHICALLTGSISAVEACVASSCNKHFGVVRSRITLLLLLKQTIRRFLPLDPSAYKLVLILLPCRCPQELLRAHWLSLEYVSMKATYNWEPLEQARGLEN